LGWITKFTKDFTNAENLKKEREKKTGCWNARTCVPRHDYEIVDGAGTVIGIVTSGTMFPWTKELEWICYSWANSALDSDIFYRIRKKNDV
jgi:aminomethyltransferase